MGSYIPGLSPKILVDLIEHVDFYSKFSIPQVGPIVPERRLAESSGVPIEVSRKGKAPPLERGRGKYSPPAPLDKFPNSGITGIVWRLQRHWPEAVPMCAV